MLSRAPACGAFVLAAVACVAARAQTGVGPSAAPVQSQLSTSGPASNPATAPPDPNAVPQALPVRPLEQALFVQPGATCLEPAKLVRRVARWLRRDTVDARIRVDVRGDPQAKERVSFVIDRAGERAERTIGDAPLDCDQLHAALALSIALAIDATVAGGDQARASAELPSDEQLLAQPEPAEPPGPPYFRLGLGLFGHATSGLLTDPSWAASARLELGFMPWLDLRVGAVGSQLDHQSLRGTPDESTFYVGLLAARLDACAVVAAAERLRAMACLGAMLGRLSTEGHGFSPDQARGTLWSAALGGIEAQAQLWPWLALAASVDLVVPLAKHRIQAVDALGQAAGERLLTPVGVLIGAGPVLRFF
jgi:hypothetical protein